MKKQNNRDRVRFVLNGQQPVLPVADLGGRVASISLPAYLDLKSYLGFGRELGSETITLLNTVGRFDERVLEAPGVPVRYLHLRPASSFKLETAADGSYRDEWGGNLHPEGTL